MPSVDLDSPEHAICSHALERARETLTERTVSWHRAVKRAEKAEGEVARLTWALKEIAVGRTSVDNDGPLDPFTSMVGRFLSIAQDALRGCGS